jgi:hypothetical protein
MLKLQNLIFIFSINKMSTSISDTITDSAPAMTTTELDTDFYTSAADGTSFLKEISWTTWLLIVLILAFLGVNVFVYLAKGTQDVSTFLQPIVEKVASIFGGVTSQVVDVTAEGAKAVVGTTADTVNTGLTTVQEITPTNNGNNNTSNEPQPKTSSSQNKGQDVNTVYPPGDVAQANTLNRALNSSTPQKQQKDGEDYVADDSSSSIQQGAPKAGWCYIGQDRGFRTCAEVGVNDTCMSGDIFPSHEICVNPRLRA